MLAPTRNSILRRAFCSCGVQMSKQPIRSRRLEIASTGRAAADRDGPECADPADEHGESALGCAAYPRRTAQARFCSRSIKRRLWSSDVDLQVRDGEPFCGTM